MIVSALSDSQRFVNIIGTGMTAMALAAILEHFGLPFSLESQQWSASTEGGIQLAPNGVDILTKIGMGEALRKNALKPKYLCLIDGVEKRCLLRIPLQTLTKQPYLLLGRKTLVRLLCHNIHLEDKQQKFQQSRQNHTIFATCSALNHNQSSPEHFGRFTRIRWLRDKAQDGCKISVVMLQKRHAVCYPFLQEDKTIAYHGTLYEHKSCEHSWTLQAWQNILEKCNLIESSTDITQYRAFAISPKCSPNLKNSHKHMVPLGEARGFLLPFMAQGFSMALEDDFTFATALRDSKHSNPLAQYHRKRKRRLRFVRAMTICAGMLFHGSSYLPVPHHLRMMPLHLMPKITYHMMQKLLTIIYDGIGDNF